MILGLYKERGGMRFKARKGNVMAESEVRVAQKGTENKNAGSL